MCVREVELRSGLAAEGSRDESTVWTCSEPSGQRRPGFWGGLRIFGRM